VKILALSNLYPPDVLGGYEIGCKQAVDGLRARGHEVRVLTTTPRSPIATAAEPGVARRLQLNDLWYNATRPRSHPAVDKVWDVDANWFSAHNTHALIREVDDFRPDVVYVWMILGVGGLGLMGCLQYLKVPWVWHLMDEVPAQLCGTNWRVLPPLARAFDRFISGRYIACSRAMVARIEAKGIRLAGEVEILPNWVVGDRPPRRDDPYRPGARPLRIVSAGRITRQKGVGLLVEAARLLRAEGVDDFTIDVYGPVIDPEIPDHARSLGLGGHLRFLGVLPQDRLADEFSRADLFAFPTEEREPFGFAPLEAASRGCVPLIAQVCGIGEWLVHGVHCLKAPRSARAFAATIAAVARGEVDLGPIGRRASSVVHRDFHRDAVLPRIERVLARASRSPRDGGGTPDEAYRMALVAERLAHAIVQEPFYA